MEKLSESKYVVSSYYKPAIDDDPEKGDYIFREVIAI